MAGKVIAITGANGGLGRALAVACDVTSPNSVRAAFAEIVRTFPKLDVFINNAGIFNPFLVEEASDEQILGSIMTNLAGPILCARSAIPMMERGGLIINVSSESISLPFAHSLIYQSTKAGLERFSLGFRDELQEKGIRTCIVRAGQMMGPGSSAEIDPGVMVRFMEASKKRGVDLMTRGVSQYDSATQVFRNVIDLPNDLHVDVVSCHARIPS